MTRGNCQADPAGAVEVSAVEREEKQVRRSALSKIIL
jgi:hypothetical protein